ncbi:UDP-glucose 4-epimerase [candidate division WOR-1 bacterium RIFOXYB2_FULL_42_35]|uniref:UDP-glucose 4-epimerase n=1 Tax=candidate division WOR-1 bacterium RIFOXYC2_FULL_41_25 TaxID=1802586 RepID=A0A1F4TM40_UNCSA|nr:MAG: UDP-glucose 4-epimerase [candidate division WOR-1 bacterium RIFOXYA2_FULL_41_14]OGC24114.1 MAG: UDP-glucose 4-epimerase [candidate division WOR-1 bacterium RIFOXYB2_FULL_42_35]OGC33801.1 MAG: UDP-glucose 4-epimerase [candidate division WOR-1 bacterium RIFOXYC2_FULL_41_25]OGC43696.1 MAG: UDP-glucose 4-epimerase [candidate division WOR-1 bacterium RIFOXYD2_FULL_41_8]
MKILVTGAAGFIGSHLAEKLLALGHEVVGIDVFTSYYSRKIKEYNLINLRINSKFTFIEADIATVDLKTLFQGVKIVFHQAAQAGVRASWGKDFNVYLKDNLEVTQKLLEAAKEVSLDNFVYASSSSVYGDTELLPMWERNLPKPYSPYGVSKLAAEHLCYLYWKNYGVPTVSLRYFTVYGPRQRPDMAFHKFIRALIFGKPIEIYGDGEQTRDFTYISDIVEANIAVIEKKGIEGEVFNLGGGSRIFLKEAAALIVASFPGSAQVVYGGKQKGDVRHTAADFSKAKEILGYNPKVTIQEGLKNEIAYLKKLYQEVVLP